MTLLEQILRKYFDTNDCILWEKNKRFVGTKQELEIQEDRIGALSLGMGA